MIRYIAIIIAATLTGILIGAYLFSDTQPRSFLHISTCTENCFSQEQLLGLLGSVGVQKSPDLIPQVVKETDKTIAMKHPIPQAELHYVIIPKKDIKTPSDIAQEDAPYLTDAFGVIRQLVEEQGLVDYKIIANGPGFQTVEYLHFHLVSDLPQ